MLSKNLDVRIWDDDTFHLGDHPLESLGRQMLLSDFALLIVHPDDKIVEKGKDDTYTTRDNVLFELGLFIGALGKKRGFFLAVNDHTGKKEKKVKIPTDLVGIIRMQVNLVSKNTFDKPLQKQCNLLLAAVDRAQKSMGIRLLPSTSLTTGYFNNFLKEVCLTMQEDDFSLKSDEKTLDIAKRKYELNIVLPSDPVDVSQQAASKFVKDHCLERIQVQGKTGPRKFPFYLDPKKKRGKIVLYDYPTTLRAAYEAIKIAMPEGTTQEEQRYMMIREIEHFRKSLNYLLCEPESAGFRKQISIKYTDEIK